MIKKYSCELSQFKSEQGAKKHLLSKARKEWEIVEVITRSSNFLVENCYEFDDGENICFFVKDDAELFYCGPINVRRKKLQAYTLWIFDYCIFLYNEYHVVKNLSYMWDTLSLNCMPKKLIYNPWVVVSINGTLEIVKAKEIYNAKDIQDIHIIDMLPNSDSMDRTYTLTIYINANMKKKISRIQEFEPSIAFPEKIYYKTALEQEYIVYDYILNEKHEKCKHLESYYRRQETNDFWNLIYLGDIPKDLQQKQMNSKQQKLFDKRIPLQNFEYFEYYFATTNAIAEIVVENYFAKYAEVLKIPAMFAEDFSHNYRIKIAIDNRELLYLWLYFCKEQMVTEPSVCGIEISKLIRWYEGNEKPCDEVVDVVRLLEKRVSKKYQKIVELWMQSYPYKSLLSVGGEYLKYRSSAGKKTYLYVCENLKSLHEKYSAILQDLVEQGKISPRWKSEFSLYMLVKSYFPNAIYQYRSQWLQGQSLDIFIPDNNMGIEYQGIQHYKSVDIFGGEKGLKETQKRDTIKREKCKENNIQLLEWHYSMEIEDKNFIKMLRTLNCVIPKKQYTNYIFEKKVEKEEQTQEIICQYDLNGNLIGQYKSVSEAARKSGVQEYMIRRACMGIRNSAGSYQWRKVDTDNIEEKISALKKKISTGSARKVIQVNAEGSIVEYNSIAEAVRLTGINSKSIRDAATGKQKHAGGYRWKYKE